MQAFKEQLSAVDIAAVVTYQRNAWQLSGRSSPAKHDQKLRGNYYGYG